MYRYSYSIVLLTLCLLLGSPTTAVAKTRIWPTGIQLGTDVFRPAYYYFYTKTGYQFELNGTIDFAHILLEGDFGWGRTRWQGRNKDLKFSSSYQSVGQYFRVGLNYNFAQDTPDKNLFFVGARYAMSFFKDALNSRVSYDSKGEIQNGPTISGRQDDVRAAWFEATTGFKVKLLAWLYMGCTVRYKFGLMLSNTPHYLPFDVLGWGFRDEEAFGINYYLTVRIPLTRSAPDEASNKASSKAQK